MDLRSDGLGARPAAYQQILPEEWGRALPGPKGVIIVYDGGTDIRDPVYNALCTMHPKRPVVLVRSQTRRIPVFLERFFVVSLFDNSEFSHFGTSDFSYYQPDPRTLSGYVRVRRAFLARAKRPKDSRRRGFAFFSYSGQDKAQVCERLVPALAANDIGFFDYRFSERLDHTKLLDEIERRVERCAVMVVYATTWWAGSQYTQLEVELAVSKGRPIVAVQPPIGAARLEFPATPCTFGGGEEAEAKALREAIELATGRPLPCDA